MNYTNEQTEYMIQRYTTNPTRKTVDALAAELNKSTKSIIGKLSREGVYRRQEYVSKTGEKPVTKIELVHMLADSLEMESEDLKGLEKTPKLVLKRMLAALE
jgi:hypothetical protein